MSYTENPRGWNQRDFEAQLKATNLIIIHFRHPAWIIVCDLRPSWNSDPHVVNFSVENLYINDQLAKEKALEKLNEIRIELKDQPVPPSIYFDLPSARPRDFFSALAWKIIEYEVATRGNPDELKEAVNILK